MGILRWSFTIHFWPRASELPRARSLVSSNAYCKSCMDCMTNRLFVSWNRGRSSGPTNPNLDGSHWSPGSLLMNLALEQEEVSTTETTVGASRTACQCHHRLEEEEELLLLLEVHCSSVGCSILRIPLASPRM